MSPLTPENATVPSKSDAVFLASLFTMASMPSRFRNVSLTGSPSAFTVSRVRESPGTRYDISRSLRSISFGSNAVPLLKICGSGEKRTVVPLLRPGADREESSSVTSPLLNAIEYSRLSL